MHYDVDMRTTLTLDADIYESAKVIANSSARSLGSVISELVRIALRSPQSAGTNQHALDSNSSDLPTFIVPDDGEIIPADRATRLLDEELLD